MSIINRNFFVGEINIPNANSVSISETLDLFIEKYENDFLINVLGQELYSDFITGVSQPVIDQIWKDLIFGKTYTHQNQNYTWKGLVATRKPSLTVSIEDETIEPLSETDTPVRYESLIAYYIYYWYVRNNVTQTAAMGEVSSSTENAMNSSPAYKLTRAWNWMSEWVEKLVHYLDANTDSYPNWTKQNTSRLLSVTRKINAMGI
jgi:hypothetical protein